MVEGGRWISNSRTAKANFGFDYSGHCKDIFHPGKCLSRTKLQTPEVVAQPHNGRRGLPTEQSVKADGGTSESSPTNIRGV